MRLTCDSLSQHGIRAWIDTNLQHIACNGTAALSISSILQLLQVVQAMLTLISMVTHVRLAITMQPRPEHMSRSGTQCSAKASLKSTAVVGMPSRQTHHMHHITEHCCIGMIVQQSTQNFSIAFTCSQERCSHVLHRHSIVSGITRHTKV